MEISGGLNKNLYSALSEICAKYGIEVDDLRRPHDRYSPLFDAVCNVHRECNHMSVLYNTYAQAQLLRIPETRVRARALYTAYSR